MPGDPPFNARSKHIEARIHRVRGHKVLLDADLAELYGVSTKRLNEQVRRNPERFPDDFMFILTNQELAILKSQFATSSSQLGGTPGHPGHRVSRSHRLSADDSSLPISCAAA